MLNSANDKSRFEGPATQEMADELERILRSRPLQNSESLRALLQYVGGRVIDGHDSQVKEYTIAVEVFGRSKDFNASTDSLVRVQAKRLRDKLKEYYATEGKSDKVLIDLPKGHYTAVFSYVDHQNPPLNGAADPPAQIPSAPALTPTLPSTAADKRLTVVLLGVVIALGVVVSVLFNSNRVLSKQAAEADSAQVAPSYGMFWEPFIESRIPTILVLSNPPVYKFVNPVDPDVLVKSSVELTPQQSSWLAGTLGEEFLTKQEMKYRLALSPREYTGVGEAIGLYQVAELLRSSGKSPMSKQSRTVSADDLKRNNVVLLGSVWSNVWSGKLPVKEDFTFTIKATIENDNPKDGEQTEYRPAFNETTGELVKDYALITVRPGVTNESVVMVLAGIKSEGTQAAAEFVTRREYLDDLNHRLEQISWGGGAQKYYQVLLEADVDNGIPTMISVVAIHRLEVARKN
jgi:hypothetical protein